MRAWQGLIWIRLLVILSLGLILVNGCKKEEENGSDIHHHLPDSLIEKHFPLLARDTLYYIMKEFYYWYNKPECESVTQSNKGNYNDPYELLEAMRYQAVDRWSFVADYDEFMGQMQGTFVGHGFRIGIDDSGNARIAMIYNLSSLYASGVRRGWIIIKINNTDPVPAILNGTYADLIGPSQEGITNTFLFQKPDGTDVTISSTKSTFQINTVEVSEILQLTSGTTGHLVFDAFITPTADELATAFAVFKANNIKDLILDMRYNTGGYLAIAQTLASYIAGNSKKGGVFAKLTYNDKHQGENYTFPFVTTPYSLDLSRIVIITTRSTASASEAVINGLKAIINVIIIGDTTNGKPCGMNGWPILNKYYAWPVTFEMTNARGAGNYYFGFAPDKIMPDDITRDFSDPEEMCLKEAIRYLETGSFSTKGVQVFKRHPVYSEKPKWLDNVFLDKK